jgi:uncharacterized protein
MEEPGQTQREMYRGVPLFALPSYVLFPHTLVPFHVFEQGYLRTVEACLSGERLLVVAGVSQDDDGLAGQPYQVAGLGRVVSDRRYRDGRIDVFVHGLSRVRIEHQHRVESVSLVDVAVMREPLRDDLDAIQQRIVDLATSLARTQGVNGGALGKVLSTRADLGVLSDRLAALLVDDMSLRQYILEQADPAVRALALEHLMVESLMRDEPDKPVGSGWLN